MKRSTEAVDEPGDDAEILKVIESPGCLPQGGLRETCPSFGAEPGLESAVVARGRRLPPVRHE